MALLQSEKAKLQPGDTAPEFSLKNIDGQTVSLSQFKGKPVAIIFMCNHCPYVIPKMEEIGQLATEFEGKAVIIGINPNGPDFDPSESFENMQKVAQQFGYKYYLVDETQEIAKAYDAVCTPDPFVFDADHKLVYHGRINDAMSPGAKVTKHDLREVLNKVIADEKVEDWFVPSQGCSIKWRD